MSPPNYKKKKKQKQTYPCLWNAEELPAETQKWSCSLLMNEDQPYWGERLLLAHKKIKQDILKMFFVHLSRESLFVFWGSRYLELESDMSSETRLIISEKREGNTLERH